MKSFTIVLFCLIAQIGVSQVQEIETSNGAKLIIEEEPANLGMQLPVSLKMSGNYKTGGKYFQFDGINGLTFFANTQVNGNQANTLSIDYSGLKLLDFDNTSRFTIGYVSGKTRVSSQEVEILGGSDLSEYFDVKSESSVKPGMLVSIAGEDGSLAITNKKRDKKVVGIVSGANGVDTGLMMGQEGTIAHGDVPVALTGRTYVYATTENGIIEAGDFLTSSSTPGYAMKAKRYRKAKGAIVGKAMTSLKEGSGFVLVLVNLQ